MGYHAQKTVTSTPIEACVGSGAMVTRNRLVIKNVGPFNLYYAYESADATSAKGMLLEPYASMVWEYGGLKPGKPDHVYVACATGETATVCIEEY
ncbi:MAG: hypothetical protein BWY66_00220 [bacterium ADurb.Bin374]|nr:MAG: hypothetical protein BWY66_00220 [bacterium ADurb.Bin374]